jgi:hypothetical protein
VRGEIHVVFEYRTREEGLVEMSSIVDSVPRIGEQVVLTDILDVNSSWKVIYVRHELGETAISGGKVLVPSRITVGLE